MALFQLMPTQAFHPVHTAPKTDVFLYLQVEGESMGILHGLHMEVDTPVLSSSWLEAGHMATT